MKINVMIKNNFLKVLILISILIFQNEITQAFCASPAGAGGQIQWLAGAPGKIKWCNNTNWIDPVVVQNLSCSGSPTGQILYGAGDLQFCDGTFWQSMKGPAMAIPAGVCSGYPAGEMLWDSAASAMKFCDGTYWRAMYAATTPTVSVLTLNSGAASTTNNFVQVALTATNSPDAVSLITHFCFKSSSTGAVPSAPNSTDTCWAPVNGPQPGLVPAQGLSFTGYYYTLGFSTATYTVYAWVKNNINLISAMSAAGAGTAGADRATINFTSPLPPVIINPLSTTTDSPSAPPTTVQMTISAGQDVYIKWNASSTSGFSGTPVTLSYTTDETNYTQIATNVANAANAGCTVDGVTYTGCYRWVAGSPTSTYFKVRIAVIDVNGISAYNSASPNNITPFQVLAGNTDTGFGGSASNAMIFNNVSITSQVDSKIFVVTPDGKYFIRDIYRGILKIDPADGKLVSFIPLTGSYTDGAIGTATLASANARMTLDFQGRLLIYDDIRIRRVDLTTNMVTTIIGGGASTTSGSSATSIELTCSVAISYCQLTPLPNGDIYFFRVQPTILVNAGGAIWKYQASNGNVYAITPSGTGTTESPALDIATSTLRNFALDFDVTTSVINKFYALMQESPCTGCGTYHRPAELNQSTWASVGSGWLAHPTDGINSHPAITAMDGHIYVIPEVTARSLWRYNVAGNTWTKLLGGTSNGRCVDGTAATSCNVYLQDAFVTASGQIFFVDNGLIRNIDASNNVQTLFGQSRSFGDGALASGARFNSIRSMDYSNFSGSDKVIVLDSVENTLREIVVGGNITKLIGTGISNQAVSGNLAVSEPIYTNLFGDTRQIYYDHSNDDIFVPSVTTIQRYDRASGRIYTVVGGGATTLASADGTVGASVNFSGWYSPQIIGFDGTKILAATNQWSGSAYINNMWKLYDKADSYRQSHFAGHMGAYTGSFSANGTAVSGADILNEFANTNLRGFWDSTATTWYFGSNVSNIIKSLPVGGNIGTFATLPRAIKSMTMVKNASSQWVIYYCAVGTSQIYKYNVTTTTETALPWPHSSIACSSFEMQRSASRNSIIFPYVQNHLMAIGEIIDTP